jgi:hypothetical protein
MVSWEKYGETFVTSVSDRVTIRLQKGKLRKASVRIVGPTVKDRTRYLQITKHVLYPFNVFRQQHSTQQLQDF